MSFRDILHKDILELLRRRKSVSPIEDPTSFGNIALEKHYISEDVLKGAILTQSEKLKIGEILVAMGQLSAEQCEDVLIEQASRRTADKGEKAWLEMRKQRAMLERITTRLNRLNTEGDDQKGQ